MGEILEILKEISVMLNKPKEEKRTFNIPEAAKYSGIGHEKIRELISTPDTDFPFFRVGQRALVDKIAFDRWLEKVTHEHRTI